MIKIIDPTYSVRQPEINGTEIVKSPFFGNYKMNINFTQSYQYSRATNQSYPIYTDPIRFFFPHYLL